MLHTSTRSPEGVCAILSLEGVGPRIGRRIADEWSTIDQVINAPVDALSSLGLNRVAHSLLDRAGWQTALSSARRQMEVARGAHIRPVTLWDPEYPPYLAALNDAPLLVYIRGALQPAAHTVACIGTREPSAFGAKAARDIAGFLAAAGWSIVSGLATGIDTLSHEAALAVGGHTVAVLANGLDSVYPKANTDLAERIVRSGGALISEHPVGTPIIPRNLVQRDRIQSGMSLATVVVQTDLKGGSMHTVRFTLLQQRLLFAPSPPATVRDELKSRGIIALAEQTGFQLASILGGSPDYERLLRIEYAHRPPAKALRSRDDYSELLGMLRLAYDGAHRRSEPGPAQLSLF